MPEEIIDIQSALAKCHSPHTPEVAGFALMETRAAFAIKEGKVLLVLDAYGQNVAHVPDPNGYDWFFRVTR